MRIVAAGDKVSLGLDTRLDTAPLLSSALLRVTVNDL